VTLMSYPNRGHLYRWTANVVVDFS
jgi:hypothetical protein